MVTFPWHKNRKNVYICSGCPHGKLYGNGKIKNDGILDNIL